MAKNQKQTYISPKKFMQTKARTLPIGKCYVNDGWEENGFAIVVVTRIRPSGNLVYGQFLVDTYCLGVKDAFFVENMDVFDFEDAIDKLDSSYQMVEFPYVEAHNLIYGAIAFAEEAGIKPCQDYAFARYVLEEDTDEIPLIEYEYGHKGKYFLIVGPAGVEKKYIGTLQDRLGDNFEYLYINEEYDEYYEDEELPSEFRGVLDSVKEAILNSEFTNVVECHRAYYPKELKVKNKIIVDVLSNQTFECPPSKKKLKQILALPSGEAVKDICNYIMYTLGLMYNGKFTEDEFDQMGDAVLLGSFLLAEFGREESLPTILELLKSDFDVLDLCYLMDEDCLYYLLRVHFKENFVDLEELICDRSTFVGVKLHGFHAMLDIVLDNPLRRYELVFALKRIIGTVLDRLPEKIKGDDLFLTSVVDVLAVCGYKELEKDLIRAYDSEGYMEGVGRFLSEDDMLAALRQKKTEEAPRVADVLGFFEQCEEIWGELND